MGTSMSSGLVRSAVQRTLATAAATASIGLLASSVHAAEPETKTGSLEEVTVTGSRIQLPAGMTAPTPVTAVTADELQVMSATNVTSALTQLPQFFNSQTAENFGSLANVFFTSPGGGSLNLRGLGQQRTLTLLDGRRMPAASLYGGPDINTFPDQLLKSIDTVTGGASAAYGTDAVAGVVNYKLDTKFEGVRVLGQYGQTFYGDGDNSKYSLAVGHALTEKLHLLFSASYSDQQAINNTGGRSWYQSCGLMPSPYLPSNAPNSATSPSNPRLIDVCNLRSTQYSYEGVLNPAGTGPLGRITFDARGNPIPFSPGSVVAGDGLTQVGGSGEDPATQLNVLLPSQRMSNVFAYLDYNVTDTLNVYFQGIHNEQTLERLNTVGAYYPQNAAQFFTIYSDNAFLPASIRQIMTANNITSTTFSRQLAPSEGAIGSTTNDSKMNVGTLGFKSKVFGDWSLDGYAQFGETKLDAIQAGSTRQDRIFLAADAVLDPADGKIKCRIQRTSPGLVPDCQPLNMFGSGAPSAAALDWVTGFDPGVKVNTVPYIASTQSYDSSVYSYTGDADKHRLIDLKQNVAELLASGNLFEGWAGPISAAFGGNYRKEEVDQKVRASQGNTAADPNYFPVWCNDNAFPTSAATPPQCAAQISQGTRPYGTNGAIGVQGVPGGVQTNIVETQFSNVPNVSGDYSVKEVFTEVNVPLLSGLSWMKNMSVNGAYRWSDYTGSGGIGSWKTQLNMEFTSEIRFRGSYSVDTRAGNIADRFDRTGGANNVIDKKTPAAGGLPIKTGSYTITIVQGGNPNIEPEEGHTITLGLVYQPEWLTGLDLSVDWVRINIFNAIESLTSQQIVDQCYVSGDQNQCGRITRGVDSSVTPNQDVITFINRSAQNLGKATYNGVDFELGYTHPIALLGGGEHVSARIIGGFLTEYSTTNFFGVKTDNTESVPLQTFKRKALMTFGYNRDGFNWNLNGQYNSGGIRDKTWNLPDANGVINYNVTDRRVGSSVYWDTRLSYRMLISSADVEFFANIQNLFDRDPVYIPLQGVGIQTTGGYDQLGRRFVLGADLRF
jgi:iron complex outermembrane recepter protein